MKIDDVSNVMGEHGSVLALYDKDAFAMDQQLGDGPKTIIVPASTVEAWSTGDADILNSEMMTALIKAQEAVSSGAKKRVEVVVAVVAT